MVEHGDDFSRTSGAVRIYRHSPVMFQTNWRCRESPCSLRNASYFLSVIADPTDPANETSENPNQFFVFAFDDNDLPGFVPQRIKGFSPGHDEDDDHDRNH